VVGYILPGTLLNQVDAAPARRLLLDRGLHLVVNLGQGVFGPKVLNTSSLVVSGSQTASGKLIVSDLAKMAATNRRRALSHVADVSWERWAQTVKTDPHLTFFTGDNRAAEILGRMRAEHPALASILDGPIERGVTPDVAEAHALARGGKDAKRLEPELLRPSVSGDQVRRYRSWKVDQFLLYTTRETSIHDFPRCLEHMKRFRHKITCKEVAAGTHPWWALHRPRDPAIFESPKFIGLTTSKKIELVYDRDSSAFVTDAMYVFRAPPEVDPYVLMGVLQSRAFLFLYRVANQGESRVIPQVKASKLQELPVPTFRDDRLLDIRERLRIAVEAMYQFAREIDVAKTEHQRVVVQRQASSTEHQIDQIVYELYGLTDEEIRIVEEATAGAGAKD